MTETQTELDLKNYWQTFGSSVSKLMYYSVHVLFKHCCTLARTVDDLFVYLIWLGGSICEPLMQTTTAGRVMLIHQLVLKGDLKELKKEIAKDIGQFTSCFNLLPRKNCMWESLSSHRGYMYKFCCIVCVWTVGAIKVDYNKCILWLSAGTIEV